MTGTSRGARPAAALLAVLLAALVPGLVPTTVPAPALAAPAAAPATPVRGGAGAGDPYFPLDGNGGIDVVHYGIHDRYDFATGRLSGWTVVTLRATTDLRSFHLDLLLPVRSVRVDGRPARFGKPNAHELRVVPRARLRAGTLHRVRVSYAGRPGSVGWRGERNWLASANEVVTMNEPHMAPWWFPANDHPSDKARVDVHVTVPRGNKVISNGRRVSVRARGASVRTHWRAVEPMAPYLAFFAAGRFRVRSGVDAGRPWLVAVSRQLSRRDQRSSMRLLRRTPAITRWLEAQLGPYPFSVTGGVTTSLSPGFALENQTRPTYPALFGPDPGLVVHEMAHQWFGNSVSLSRWRDIWLNEGLATYLEWRWEETHGGMSARERLTLTYEDLLRFPGFWDLPIGDPGPRRLFDEAVYVRGAMTVQALRNRLGETAFWQVLRTWARHRHFGHGTIPEFVTLAETVSGQDLDGFFRAWLHDPRPPARTTANGLS